MSDFSAMTRRIILALIALFGALIMITAGGWLLGWHKMWAFSHLIFLPTWLRWLLGAVIIIGPLCLLLVQTERCERFLHRILSLGITCWLLVPGWGILLWLFRERTWYGDALLKLELLNSRTLQTDPYVWKEPLDSAIAYSFSGLLARFGWPPEIAVAIVSVAAGMLYLASICYMAKALFEERLYRITFVIGMLAIGSSQLWFGHIENYSLVTAVATFSMALAVGCLQGQIPLWPAGLISGLAVSIHPQAVFVLPGLLVLLDRKRWWKQIGILALSGLAAPLFTVGLFFILGVQFPAPGSGYAGDQQLFWTLAQALSPARLLGAISNLWLLTPLLLLWIVTGLIGATRRSLRRDRNFIYFTVVAVSLLVYHFWFQNDLPRYRDWDLYAIVGPGVTAWGLYAALRLIQHERAKNITHHIWTPTLAVSLFIAVLLTTAWIGVNHHFILLHPQPDMRMFYERYREVDLLSLYSQASIFPPNPICTEGNECDRVAVTQFNMPQDGDTRPTLFAHAPATITFPPVKVPEEDGFLWLSPALDPKAWEWGGDGVTFSVVVMHNGQEQILWSRHLSPQNQSDLGWQEVMLPLDAYRGDEIVIKLITSPGPAGNDAADRAGWGYPWLMRGTLDNRFE